MLAYLVSLTSIVLVSFLQTTSLIFIGPLKPNLVFALLATLAHVEKGWVGRSILILVSALILKFSPVVGWIDIIFISTALLIVALVDYLPWRRILNSLVAVVAGTIIMGISRFDFGLLTLELIANIVITIIFFILVKLFYEEERQNKKNKF